MDVTRLAVAESAICKPKSGNEVRPGVRFFRPGLSFKLVCLVVSVSLVAVLASTLLLFNFQRRQLIANALAATTIVSNIIEANLHHAMLTDDWKMVDDVVQAVVAEQSIDTLRILDTQGIVGVSSRPGEVGKRFALSEPACQFCHVTESPPANKTVVFTSDAGRQALLNVNLIHNQPQCWACHTPDNRVLGLLMMEIPLSGLQDQLTEGLRRTGLLAAATFALLVGLMVLALSRYVIRPVNELARGVAEISAGNLDYQVQVTNQDELGELAESFDAMRQQLKISQAEMERREQELAILNDVALAATQLLDLQEIMDFALDTVVNMLGMAAGLIFLWDEATDRYTLRASHGVSRAQIDEIDRRRRAGSDITQTVADTGKEVFVADMAADGRFDNLWDNLQGRSFVKIPLMSKGAVVGVMELITPVERRVTERGVEFLKAVGREIGIAIENAQLYRQLRYLAVLEERDRLARELHDHLAQTLGYLNVKAAMTDDLLSGDQISQAHESLLDLKRVTKAVYTDVREAIFNLRTAVSSRIGLLPTLQDYLAEYRAHYGLDVRLIVSDEDAAEFSSEAASQLLRIIQEALTNVRKHAGATRAWVRFDQNGGYACVSIHDDGQGFDPAQAPGDGRQAFGLQIMRERAESVGGSLELDARPGQGTRVVVRVPLASQEG
jgi:nitrate/nitrite-specific signal transduction histidine kinase